MENWLSNDTITESKNKLFPHVRASSKWMVRALQPHLYRSCKLLDLLELGWILNSGSAWNLLYQLWATSLNLYSAAFSTQKMKPSGFLMYTFLWRESPWKNADDMSKVPIRHLLSGTRERIAFTVFLPQVGDSNCTWKILWNYFPLYKV